MLNFLGDHAPYVTAGRVTAMAIAPSCTKQSCRLYVAAAGGGIWRTTKALSGNPGLGVRFGQLRDERDRRAHHRSDRSQRQPPLRGHRRTERLRRLRGGHGHLQVHGRRHDLDASRRQHRDPRLCGPAFDARSISAIVVDPGNANTIYVASARGVRGISSVSGGPTIDPPVATPYGVWKSTDGGANFTFLWDGGATGAQCDTIFETFFAPCSLYGATDFELDPSNGATMYASAFGIGTWRSLDGGANWTQILGPTFGGDVVDRADISAVKQPNGKTRHVRRRRRPGLRPGALLPDG